VTALDSSLGVAFEAVPAGRRALERVTGFEAVPAGRRALIEPQQLFRSHGEAVAGGRVLSLISRLACLSLGLIGLVERPAAVCSRLLWRCCPLPVSSRIVALLSSRSLSPFYVCARMLTYAHVWWRMVTYGDVW